MIQNSFFLKSLDRDKVLAGGLRPGRSPASWGWTGATPRSPKPSLLQAYLSNNIKLENSGLWSLTPKRHLIYFCKNMSSSAGTLRSEAEASSYINQQSLFSYQKSKLPNIVSQKSDLSCVFSYVQSSETRLMNRFLNFLTKKGKKSTAESIFSKTLYLLIKKANEGTITIPHEAHSIFTILDQAISNVKPFFEVKKVRVAGTTYQVPSLMKSKRQEGIAINWILQSASERKKKNPSQRFENCLAFEIFEAFQKQGQARMKRNELHKLAEANRAFSHFRWW